MKRLWTGHKIYPVTGYVNLLPPSLTLTLVVGDRLLHQKRKRPNRKKSLEYHIQCTQQLCRTVRYSSIRQQVLKLTKKMFFTPACPVCAACVYVCVLRKVKPKGYLRVLYI
jgi:hypothetical protein